MFTKLKAWLDKKFPGWRDTLERLAWTAVSAILGALPVILADLPEWLFPVLTAAINWLSIKVRQKLDALPSPGEGLPGATVADAALPPPHG